jgi:hypothetical protein
MYVPFLLYVEDLYYILYWAYDYVVLNKANSKYA